MSEITPFEYANNPFEVAFAPAKPVLAAAIALREPFAWLQQQRRSRRSLFNPDDAAALLELIPPGHRLAEAGALFLAAQTEPAPESWIHAVLGLMMDSYPNADHVPEGYRWAVTDGVYGDPEVWEGYSPGFSAAVIVRAVREARRTIDDLPSPGAFLKLCVKNRNQFRTWRSDIDDLMQLRYAAEDAMGVLAIDDESDMPLPDEASSRPPSGRLLTHDPNDDGYGGKMPF